jgi:hypothetical protein
MVDEKYIVLMHKDIDDEISAAEKVLLLEYISKNSEAEALYRQLSLVNKSLSDVKEIDPPAGLKPSIIDAIDSERYGQSIKKEASIIEWRSFFQRQRVQMALSIAAGIIIGLVLYPLIGYSPGEHDWDSAVEITGTIGPNDSVQGQKKQSKQVSLNEIQGSIEFTQTRDIIKIGFNFSGQSEYNIRVNYEPNILTILSLQPHNAINIGLHQYRNEIRISATDAFSLLFFRNSMDKCELPVTLLINGKQVYSTLFLIN